ncbi:MAG: hypothetical protein M1834_006210 [Cirrosporium novae-zelandiae]|nr:MAG: hypothetical protein M1834_006210 [Cirrosporium novae-zelandiae]
MNPGSGPYYQAAAGDENPPYNNLYYYSNPAAAPAQWQVSSSEANSQSHQALENPPSWQYPGPPSPAPPTNNASYGNYNPNIYGLMPNASPSPVNAMDTSKWGVRYNQSPHQSHGIPAPPLPPRPSSGLGQAPEHSQAPSLPPRPSHTPDNLNTYNSSFQYDNFNQPIYSQQQHWDSETNNFQGNLPPPPPPPPLPSSYWQETHPSEGTQYGVVDQQAYNSYSSLPPPPPLPPPQAIDLSDPYTPFEYGQPEFHGAPTQDNLYSSSPQQAPTSQPQSQLKSRQDQHKDSYSSSQMTVSPVDVSSSQQWPTSTDTSQPPVSPPAPAFSRPVEQNLPVKSHDQHNLNISSSAPGSPPQKTSIPSRPATSGERKPEAPYSPPSETLKAFGLPSIYTPAKSGKQDFPPQGSFASPSVPPKLPQSASGFKEEQRQDSVASTVNEWQRATDIDGAIAAWSNVGHVSPLPSSPSTPRPVASPETMSAQGSHSPTLPLAEISISRRKSEVKCPQARGADSMLDDQNKSGPPKSPRLLELSDPYADLDPWYKASLNRYVDMLRQESSADNDADRYKVFSTFLSREAKLRAVLYDVEDDVIQIIPSRQRAPQPEKEDRKEWPQSTESKQEASTSVETQPATEKQEQNSPKHNMSPPQMSPARTSSPRPTLIKDVHERSASTPSTKDSFVIVDHSDDDAQYSPGGRPIIKGSRPQGTPPPPKLRVVAPPHKPNENIEKEKYSPGADAPIVVDVESSPIPTLHDVGFRAFSVPPSSFKPGSPFQMPNFDFQRPVYTPFQYNRVPQHSCPQAPPNKQTYKPYSALRKAAVDSGLGLHNSLRRTDRARQRGESLGARPATANIEHHETFLGGIREERAASVPGQVRPTLTLPSVLLPGASAVDHRSFTNQLRELIPKAGLNEKSQIPELVHLTSSSLTPDDFGFIHEMVVAWDKGARKKRAELEKERHERQAESENNIDDLFNNNDIGYSDIAVLEKEFREEELDRKAEEDREEVSSFTTNVYDVVTTRLQNEIQELNTKFQSTVDQLKEISASPLDKQTPSLPSRLQRLQDTSQNTELALTIFRKLEIRHQKAAEAILERAHRVKLAEVTALEARKEKTKAQVTKKEYEDKDWKFIAQTSKSKDERGKRLVRILDRVTIWANKEIGKWRDLVAKEIRNITLSIPPALPLEVKDELRSAAQDVGALLESLEVVEKNFAQCAYDADVLLNEADFEMASTSHSQKNMAKVEAEKKEEDLRLKQELEERLKQVLQEKEKVQALADGFISKLSELGTSVTPCATVSTDNASSSTPGPSPEPSTDAAANEHQERLRKALDDAKKRNMAREAAIEDFS